MHIKIDQIRRWSCKTGGLCAALDLKAKQLDFGYGNLETNKKEK